MSNSMHFLEDDVNAPIEAHVTANEVVRWGWFLFIAFFIIPTILGILSCVIVR